MSVLKVRLYSGVNKTILLAQAQAEHPDGFEILSMTTTGFAWWRKFVLQVRPLVPSGHQELRKTRLVCAIYAERERRQQQAAQQDVMRHAHDAHSQRSV